MAHYRTFPEQFGLIATYMNPVTVADGLREIGRDYAGRLTFGEHLLSVLAPPSRRIKP